MSEARYNIPKKYRIDKGMPVEALSQRIDIEKCKEIFDNEIISITWCYQIIDNEEITDVNKLIRHDGISVFEVEMRHKISTELMTEMITSLIPRKSIITFICENELAMACFIPGQKGYADKMSSTDYYPYDFSRMIEIVDYEKDSDKTIEEVHKRILMRIRQQKRIIMVEKAFESIQREKQIKQENLDLAFSVENLDKIREEAEYIKEQLRVN